jgi:hypothetical protein
VDHERAARGRRHAEDGTTGRPVHQSFKSTAPELVSSSLIVSHGFLSFPIVSFRILSFHELTIASAHMASDRPA